MKAFIPTPGACCVFVAAGFNFANPTTMHVSGEPVRLRGPSGERLWDVELLRDTTAVFPVDPCTELDPASPAEIAARAKGWRHGGDGDGIIYNHNDYGSWKEAVSYSGDDGAGSTYSTWAECCEMESIELVDEPPRYTVRLRRYIEQEVAVSVSGADEADAIMAARRASHDPRSAAWGWQQPADARMQSAQAVEVTDASGARAWPYDK